MKFNELICRLLYEKEEEIKESPVPFVIEITKDEDQDFIYNELGEIIIKLFFA